MRATEERDEVCRMAPKCPALALIFARYVSDPWFRCQALAHAARFAADELVTPIAQEAFDCASEQTDPYKRVAVLAWPVRALVERSQTELLPSWLDELYHRAQQIENPVRRLDALLLLWHGAYDFIHPSTDRLVTAFIDACLSARSWKGGYEGQNAAYLLASRDFARAMDFVERLPESRFKRRARRYLQEGFRARPRPFFWTE